MHRLLFPWPLACLFAAGCVAERAARVVPPPAGAPVHVSEEGAGQGVEAGATLIFDLLSVVDGGVQRTTAGIASLDLTLEKEWHPGPDAYSTRALVHALGTAGGSISNGVGDLQGVDNIEAPNTARLYQAWIERDLDPEGDTSLLAGLYDLTSEFDILPAAGVFIHSSPGTGADFGNSGRNGPATFPVTALGARLAWRNDAHYARFALLDGVAGDPNDPQRTQVILKRRDGLLLATEAGWAVEGEGKAALGAWHYTGSFDGLDGDADVSANPGAYVMLQHDLSSRSGELVSLFARAGTADARVHAFDRYFGVGITGQGLARGRPDDVLGCAIAAARFGSPFRASAPERLDAWEVATELTWQLRVAEFVWLQPELQYIANPGGDPDLSGAWVVGVRLIVGI